MPLPHMNMAGSASAIMNFLLNLLEKKPDLVEKIITQQTTKWLDTLDDEAIMTALIPAVRKHYTVIIKAVTGKDVTSENVTEAIGKLSDYVKNLNPTQKKRLRRVLAKLILTEKFANIPKKVTTTSKTTTSKTTTTRQDSTVEEKERVQIDYEYTAEDPRVEFLALMAYDLQQPEIGEDGVNAQLFAWGTILESTMLGSVLKSIKQYGGDVSQWLADAGIPNDVRGIQRTLGMMLDPKTFKEFLDRYPHDTEEKWEEVMELFLSNQRVKTGDMKAKNKRLRRANTWKVAFKGGPLWIIAISAAIFLICFGIWFANH